MESVIKQAQAERLRAFQLQLLVRLRAAHHAAQSCEGRLGMMLGERRCLLDLRQAAVLAPVVSITPVPLSKDWYLGLADMCGSLINVIDLARFCGMASSVCDKRSRIIVLPASLAANSAFLVPRVLGVCSLRDMVLQPETESAPAIPFGRSYRAGDGLEWTEINFVTIVNDVRFGRAGV